MKNSFTIHDLPAEERPRERLQRLGAENLSTPEILALILGRGIAGESVVVTAQRLLDKFRTMKGISEATIEELIGVRGIGLAKAAQIKAAFELARRLDGDWGKEQEEKPVIKTPEDVDKLLRTSLKDKKREHFVAVLLDTRGRLIRAATLSEGSLDSSIADPREVFGAAVAASASSVILVHNHPSGDPQPSQDDIKLTKRLAEAGQTMGITVLDHVIIGKQKKDKETQIETQKGYFSLKREGLF